MPGYGAAIVVRDWYRIRRYMVTDDGHCANCGSPVPGIYDGPVGQWGPKRLLPVRSREPRRPEQAASDGVSCLTESLNLTPE